LRRKMPTGNELLLQLYTERVKELVAKLHEYGQQPVTPYIQWRIADLREQVKELVSKHRILDLEIKLQRERENGRSGDSAQI
jgi:CHASE3 domain sensor protein